MKKIIKARKALSSLAIALGLASLLNMNVKACENEPVPEYVSGATTEQTYPGYDGSCVPPVENNEVVLDAGLPVYPGQTSIFCPPIIEIPYPGFDGKCAPEVEGYAGINYTENEESAQLTLMGYNGYSLVEGLKAYGYDSSFANRAKIAQLLGIQNYVGSYSQNVYILETLKNSIILPMPPIPEDEYVIPAPMIEPAVSETPAIRTLK